MSVKYLRIKILIVFLCRLIVSGFCLVKLQIKVVKILIIIYMTAKFDGIN